MDEYGDIYEPEPTPIYELGQLVALVYPNGHMEYVYGDEDDEEGSIEIP